MREQTGRLQHAMHGRSPRPETDIVGIYHLFPKQTHAQPAPYRPSPSSASSSSTFRALGPTPLSRWVFPLRRFPCMYRSVVVMALSPTNLSPGQGALQTGHFSACCIRKKLRIQMSWSRPGQSRLAQRWPCSITINISQIYFLLNHRGIRKETVKLTIVIISLHAAQNLILLALRPSSSSSLYVATSQPLSSISARGLRL